MKTCEFQITEGVKCNLETEFRFCSTHENRQCVKCPFPALKNCLDCGSIICQECLCCNNRAKKKSQIDIESDNFREYGLFSTTAIPAATGGILLDRAIGNHENRGIPEREVIEYAGYHDGFSRYREFVRRHRENQQLLANIDLSEIETRIITGL